MSRTAPRDSLGRRIYLGYSVELPLGSRCSVGRWWGREGARSRGRTFSRTRGAMCTLILLDRVVPQIPVIVAANRDEYFARPAAPPTRFEASAGRPAFVAPHDLEAGGTWMGVNEHGVFVGLTNRPVDVKPTGLRSRGLLVVDVLAAASAERAGAEFERAAERALRALQPAGDRRPRGLAGPADRRRRPRPPGARARHPRGVQPRPGRPELHQGRAGCGPGWPRSTSARARRPWWRTCSGSWGRIRTPRIHSRIRASIRPSYGTRSSSRAAGRARPPCLLVRGRRSLRDEVPRFHCPAGRPPRSRRIEDVRT